MAQDPQVLIAACAGRAHAAAEHAWTQGGPSADAAERRWRAFLDLADAGAAGWAGEAAAVRAAHRALLATAALPGGTGATRQAQRLIAACDALLLPSS